MLFKEPYFDDRPPVRGLSARELTTLIEAIEGGIGEQGRLYLLHCQLYGIQPDPSLGEYDYSNTPALKSLIQLTAKANEIGLTEFIRAAKRKFHLEKTENADALANFAWSMVALGVILGKPSNSYPTA